MSLPPCADCSACCNGLEVELVGGLDDVPDEMVDTSGEYAIMRRKANGDCIALVEGRCSIYASRPLECRRFERGSPECVALRKERGFLVLAWPGKSRGDAGVARGTC